MRRRLTFLGVAAALAGATAPTALAAPVAGRTATSPCHLAGFVHTAPGPCPGGLTANPAPRPQFLGGIFGGVVSGAIHKALSVIVSWVSAGAGAALRFTVSLIGASTRPALGSTWFSATYWRVAALSAVLAVPFLFAAAIHAVVRSDLALLGRAAFGYLPLAMLGVSVAAPLTALVLSATDEMCVFISRAGGHADTAFLTHAATAITTSALIEQDPFIAFFAAVITVAATLALWLELIVRDAAVDVVVLMLPLFFAAMVWPARRVWAIRAIETLVALILAKFAIVAVLTLGGTALDNASSGLAALLTGATLVLLATLSPWALLRLLPLHEVAAAAAGGLSQAPRDALSRGRGLLSPPDSPSGPPAWEARSADDEDLGSPDVGLGPVRPLPGLATWTSPRSGRSGADAPDPDGHDAPTAPGMPPATEAPPVGGVADTGSPGAAGPTRAADVVTEGSAPAVADASGPVSAVADASGSAPAVADASGSAPAVADASGPPPAVADASRPVPAEAEAERPPLPEQFRPGIVDTPIVINDGREERMTDGTWGAEDAEGGSTVRTPEPALDPAPDGSVDREWS